MLMVAFEHFLPRLLLELQRIADVPDLSRAVTSVLQINQSRNGNTSAKGADQAASRFS